MLTESRAMHLLHINIWRYFEVRLVGTVLLHAPVHALSSSYTHLCMLRLVLLFYPRLHARSCSPVTRICSCSVLFSCSVHLCMPSPVLLFHPRLHARSCSLVRCTFYSLHHSCCTLPLSQHSHYMLLNSYID